VITAHGREVIEAAAAEHVVTVRRLVIDVLEPEELAELGRLSDRLNEHIDTESQ